jgi:hypothetical protein
VLGRLSWRCYLAQAYLGPCTCCGPYSLLSHRKPGDLFEGESFELTCPAEDASSDHKQLWELYEHMCASGEMWHSSTVAVRADAHRHHLTQLTVSGFTTRQFVPAYGCCFGVPEQCALEFGHSGSSHGILCTDTCFWYAKLDRHKQEMLVSEMMQVGRWEVP